MRHGKSEQARVRAAEALLNRGWGLPTHYVEAEVKASHPDAVLVVGGDEQTYIAALQRARTSGGNGG